MFNKTNETKVLRDPVHGYIHVKYQVIWDCINAKEFQSKRISKIASDSSIGWGFSNLSYGGAFPVFS